MWYDLLYFFVCVTSASWKMATEGTVSKTFCLYSSCLYLMSLVRAPNYNFCKPDIDFFCLLPLVGQIQMKINIFSHFFYSCVMTLALWPSTRTVKPGTYIRPWLNRTKFLDNAIQVFFRIRYWFIGIAVKLWSNYKPTEFLNTTLLTWSKYGTDPSG